MELGGGKNLLSNLLGQILLFALQEAFSGRDSEESQEDPEEAAPAEEQKAAADQPDGDEEASALYAPSPP